MGKKERDYKDDEREAKIITTCALRFDGYRYADAHGLVASEFDYSRFIDGFLVEPDYDLPRGHLHCALFLFQRGLIKEGLLRWDSPEAKVIRELFLALCRDDVPEQYRNEEYYGGWERRHRPKLGRYLEFVRHRHEQTKYRERGTDSDL